MRIARYRYQDAVSFGFVTANGIVDHAEVPGLIATTVRELLAQGTDSLTSLEGLPTIPLSDVTLEVPVELGKVLCAGVNFPLHRAEGGLSPDRPQWPVIFSRFPDSHVASGEPIVKPTVSDLFDYEGELAVVIGKRAHNVPKAEALDYVWGYAAYNDGSVRDWQMHTPQWVPGKNFFRSGAIGPWIVSKDETGDINSRVLETRVNGEVRQHVLLGEALFSVEELIEYVSTFTPLEPGDIIAAGTPSGVGAAMDPKGFVRVGDVVEVEVSGIGVLTNTVTE
ncbi:fumarylacetoacetate hydrolase family protein [Microbacterium ulmi]|uniref:Fumarylacetoacetate hydrolase family protein n=1 Tax=Microbacterium ulmi TaxID=179095 RepID=A0A7Y2M013_9MICO|nr:fumarylacetoacetate hydrolase family protein [Microbacterium ulmi]NII68976.1 2-keto-4-pentenoate hydratase/2-oxohepta-3-ene-1,7-dioic acid hydratase in catechol pathway [Microbacterium ulmi]NNH03959.1 fumarylacetoacetate hydrolase family protein [Microbacterium ulmi]